MSRVSISDYCHGEGEPPDRVTVRDRAGLPVRGVCPVCGGAYALKGRPFERVLRRHRMFSGLPFDRPPSDRQAR
jgi:hypothetical protein